MTTHMPLDITGQVVIPDYRRQAHGGLAVVYPGLWGDTRVLFQSSIYQHANFFEVAVKVLKIRKHGGADAYWDMSNERVSVCACPATFLTDHVASVSKERCIFGLP
jgi:hypothetical protein